MAETIWWCEVKGEGIRLSPAYGGVSWENYCVPHIDLEHTVAGTKQKETYKAEHLSCGLRTL